MLGILAALAATAAAPATPADPLAPIAVYRGAWKADITQIASPFGKASHSVSTIRNDCWRTKNFYACAQTVDGVQADLVVYTFDKATGVYTTTAVLAGGGPANGGGKLLIEGKTFTYPWDQQQDGATVHMRIVNHFVGRDTIVYRSEYSRDGAAWTVIGTGTEHRLGAGS